MPLGTPRRRKKKEALMEDRTVIRARRLTHQATGTHQATVVRTHRATVNRIHRATVVRTRQATGTVARMERKNRQSKATLLAPVICCSATYSHLLSPNERKNLRRNSPTLILLSYVRNSQFI